MGSVETSACRKMPMAQLPGSDRPTAVTLRRVEQRYARGEERPLGSYAGLLGAYLAGVATLVTVGRARRVRVPERIPAADLALLTVAVFRASRLITKDSVTAVARAPFTEFKEPAGHGEVNEEVVGTGARHAVGELISCPFCISVWLATVGMFAMLAFPRAARVVCSLLSAVAGADALQFAYSAMGQATEGG